MGLGRMERSIAEFAEDFRMADGRNVAVFFRRFEFVEKVLGNKSRVME